MRKWRAILGAYRSIWITIACLGSALWLGTWLGSHRATSYSKYSRGIRALEAHQLDQAVAELGEALRENPTDVAARLELARAYRELGWSVEAAKEYEMSAKRASDLAHQAYAELAALAEKQGKKDDAKRYARAAQCLTNQGACEPAF